MSWAVLLSFFTFDLVGNLISVDGPRLDDLVRDVLCLLDFLLELVDALNLQEAALIDVIHTVECSREAGVVLHPDLIEVRALLLHRVTFLYNSYDTTLFADIFLIVHTSSLPNFSFIVFIHLLLPINLIKELINLWFFNVLVH